MTVSYATVTPTNMELTPMRVTYNSVDLGGTLSNVVVSMKYTKADIKADQLGTTVIDRRVSGFECTVTTELTEVLNKDNWKVVFPHATETSTGTKAIDFFSAVGDGDLSNSHQLVLHPLSKANSDVSEDYTFYKATASAESAITYGPTEQNRMKLVWNILPDTTTTPARFFRFGDTTI